MAGFIYYFPLLSRFDIVGNGNKISLPAGQSKATEQALADVTDWPQHATIEDCPHGPDGSSGVTIYPAPVQGIGQEDITFTPRQRWEQVLGQWIGWKPNAPPGPDDLRRLRPIAGNYLIDEAGRYWMVPIAREPASPTGRLECWVDFDAAGNPSTVIKDRHRELWELAGEYWDLRNYGAWKSHAEVGSTDGGNRPTDRTGEPEPKADAWVFKLALTALATNYRVGPVELQALRLAGVGLLDAGRAYVVCDQLIGDEILREYQAKKKSAASPAIASISPSPHGEPDALPVTDPVTAS